MYKIEPIVFWKYSDLEKAMNSFEKDGWEVVQIIEISSSSNRQKRVADVLMRENQQSNVKTTINEVLKNLPQYFVNITEINDAQKEVKDKE